jgi:hypothetical protein
MKGPLPNKYEYNGELLTVRQLAEIKGVGRSYMALLLAKYGAYDAMAYTRLNQGERMKKRYDYKGQQMTLDELLEIAAVKCSLSGLSARIKRHGVVFAVEHDDFKALKNQGGRQMKKMKDPVLPEHNPEQHYLDNLIGSLKRMGIDENNIEHEVQRRFAA